MNAQIHLLVVDDDQRLRKLLERYLTEHGYRVTTAHDVPSAEEVLASESIDAMVLDLMMPGKSGLDLTKTIRNEKNLGNPQIPILMLTALGESNHRITGLELGADDYLGKPFEPRELLLRLENILKRNQVNNDPSPQKDVLTFGSKSYDLKTQTLYEGLDVVYLTSAESLLLSIFAAQPQGTLSRDELAEKCGVTLSPRTIDVQITRLRKKIEADVKTPQYLRTIRHKGYALWPD